MSQTYPSPAPNQDLVSLHSTFLLSRLHSVLRFMPGTFAWILQEVRETNVTPPIRQNYSVKLFEGSFIFSNLLSNDILHLVVDQRQVMINLSLKIRTQNLRMKF